MIRTCVAHTPRHRELIRATALCKSARPLTTTRTRNDHQEQAVNDVLIVGGGVSGLAAAACLGRVGIRVTIATGSTSRNAHSNHLQHSADEVSDPADPGVGIWTHGLECLDRLGVLEQLESVGRYMGNAGYKDTSGNWLARPSRPLQPYLGQASVHGSRASRAALKEVESLAEGGSDGGGDGSTGASVLFVRESKLMEALRSALPRGTTIIQAEVEDIRERSEEQGEKDAGYHAGEDHGTDPARRWRRGWSALLSSSKANTDGDEVDAAESGDRKIGSVCSGEDVRWTQPFDLVLGADGAGSLVRELARTDGGLEQLGGSSGTSPTEPERRGYTVYRGVCTESAAKEAFAGAGDVGEAGEGWVPWGTDSFQTWGPGLRFASVPLAGEERMWFATVSDGVNSPGENESTPPPSNIKSSLLNKFGTWHHPIESLLRGTKADQIMWEDARAMSPSALKLAAALPGRSSDEGRRGREGKDKEGRLSGELGGGVARGVVLLGDAAHTLDPVLAQGAGVALEDAFLLAKRLQDCNTVARRSDALGERETIDGLEDALAIYARQRLDRAILLSRLSDLSQTLGQLVPPGLVRVRDAVCSVVPRAVGSRVFDGFMVASLCGKTGGAARAAVSTILSGSAGGGAQKKRFGGYRLPKL